MSLELQGMLVGIGRSVDLISKLARNQEHHPAEHDRRASKQHKAVDSVVNHAQRRFALCNPEDHRSEQGEEQDCRKVGHAFLPVRRLCASTAEMTFKSPATTMNRVP